MQTTFEDRRHAGRTLAAALTHYERRDDVTVLALPRGGVPVAFEVATALAAPLDVFIVRKLGVPGHEEFAMGAIASGGVRVLNEEVTSQLGIDSEQIERVERRERKELARREALYRTGLPSYELHGRTVILVDDGLATGASMHAAVRALRLLAPARIVVGVPLSSPDTCAEIGGEVDEIICAHMPSPLRAVGMWYRNFEQVTDEEVQELLARARGAQPVESAGWGQSQHAHHG